jgi:hypothetical protein
MEQDYAAAEEAEYDMEAEASAEEAAEGGEGPKDAIGGSTPTLNEVHAVELNIIKHDLKRRLEQQIFYHEPSNGSFAKEVGLIDIPSINLDLVSIEQKNDFARFQYALIVGLDHSNFKAKYHIQSEDIAEGDIQIDFVEFFESTPTSSDQSPSK